MHGDTLAQRLLSKCFFVSSPPSLSLPKKPRCLSKKIIIYITSGGDVKQTQAHTHIAHLISSLCSSKSLQIIKAHYPLVFLDSHARMTVYYPSPPLLPFVLSSTNPLPTHI